jgi:hypothetical protein
VHALDLPLLRCPALVIGKRFHAVCRIVLGLDAGQPFNQPDLLRRQLVDLVAALLSLPLVGYQTQQLQIAFGAELLKSALQVGCAGPITPVSIHRTA